MHFKEVCTLYVIDFVKWTYVANTLQDLRYQNRLDRNAGKTKFPGGKKQQQQMCTFTFRCHYLFIEEPNNNWFSWIGFKFSCCMQKSNVESSEEPRWVVRDTLWPRVKYQKFWMECHDILCDRQDVHGPQRVNPNDFDDPLTLFLANLKVDFFVLFWVKWLDNYWMQSYEIWCRHSPPQDEL